jgi:3-hydroxyacyl-[acyl-carrier-protein] dehydratase
MKYLPHRYPFLLVDRVLETGPDTITALKNVTANEPFFQGHFPGRPVMPGVLMIEAIAQASLILAFTSQGSLPDPNTIYYFVGIDRARFKRPVEPGDQLILKSKFKRRLRSIWMYEGSAHVNDELCCEAEVMCGAQVVK